MIQWAKNFGYTIILDQWQTLWAKNYKYTTSSSYKENLFKMFHRWHLPLSRLAKMFPNLSNKCWKCKNQEGTYYHQWWTCDRVKKYWIGIYKLLKQITKQNIEFKPEIFLLGMLPGSGDKEINYLIVHILTAARLVWAQGGKKKQSLTREW